MSASSESLDFETCRLNSNDRPEDRVKLITCYSHMIERLEELLKQSENTKDREKLINKLALTYNERGFVKYRQVDFVDAIEDYTIALNFDNRLHFTYYNRGLIHYRLGRFDQAITDMKSALDINSDFGPALKCLQEAQKDKRKQTVES